MADTEITKYKKEGRKDNTLLIILSMAAVAGVGFYIYTTTQKKKEVEEILAQQQLSKEKDILPTMSVQGKKVAYAIKSYLPPEIIVTSSADIDLGDGLILPKGQQVSLGWSSIKKLVAATGKTWSFLVNTYKKSVEKMKAEKEATKTNIETNLNATTARIWEFTISSSKDGVRSREIKTPQGNTIHLFWETTNCMEIQIFGISPSDGKEIPIYKPTVDKGSFSMTNIYTAYLIRVKDVNGRPAEMAIF
ncbi:MAG: hypothetical protein QME49_01655 [bacterium]|nr:hypothetical protein [bacterium]